MTDELEQMSPNQRRALNKALSALETFAAIWAAEIRLGAMSARIASVPSEAERAKRIEAMIEQGFIEGAYRHYLDHKDKCDELKAACATAEQSRDSVIEECLQTIYALRTPDPKDRDDRVRNIASEDCWRAIRALKSQRSATVITDAMRINALEAMANQPGGVLLHDGSERGRTGLGLRPGALVRTLREAIDTAIEPQRSGEGS